MSKEFEDKFIFAIALPNNNGHKKLMLQITPVLQKLELCIFWVSGDEEVVIENYSKIRI
jgi:hypothetical protein